MCNCVVTTISELQKNTKLTLFSATSIIEDSYHDVMLRPPVRAALESKNKSLSKMAEATATSVFLIEFKRASKYMKELCIEE